MLFKEKLHDSIKEIFPHSFVSVKSNNGFGQASMVIQFRLGKDSSEYPNAIHNNDDFSHTIWIYGVDAEGNHETNKQLSVECSTGSFSIKSENRMLAFSSVNTKWRNFKTDSEDKAVIKIATYFERLKDLIAQNKDRLTDYSKNLVEQKQYA